MQREAVKRNLFEIGQEPEKEQPVMQESPVEESSAPSQVVIDDVINEETKTWDKEKAVNSYRKLQRIVSDHQVALAQEQEARIRAEERARLLEEMTKAQFVKEPPKPEEVIPVKPTKPAKPVGYNKADAIAYPDSDSAKYEESLEKYYEDKDRYDAYRENQLTEQISKVAQTFEEKKNEELRNQEMAKRKSAGIATLARATNGDIDKATKVFEFAQKAVLSDEPSWYVRLYEESLRNNKPVPTGQQTPFKVPPASSMNTNLSTSEESGTFMGELKSRRNSHHNLFKTEPK